MSHPARKDTLRTFEPVYGPAKAEPSENGCTHLSIVVGGVTLIAVDLGSPTSSASGS